MWEYLQSRDIIDFEPAHRIIDGFLSSTEILLPSYDPGIGVVSDLMHLTAAEVALPGADIDSIRLTGLDGPALLRVSEDAAQFAVNVTDSGPFVGHNPQSSRNIWDVTLFSSDASKLVWLSAATSIEALRENFVPTIEKLADLYADRRFLRYMAEQPERLPLQAVLWRSKLAVLLRESPYEVDIESVFNAARGYPATAG